MTSIRTIAACRPVPPTRLTVRTLRTLRTQLSTLTMLVALAAAAASAQTPVPAAVVAPVVTHVGDRLRLTTTGTSKAVVGALLTVREDSVVVRRGDCWSCTPAAVPRESIISVERSTRPGEPVLGGVLGFLFGAALGAGGVALYAQHDMRVNPCHDGPCGIGYAYAGPLFALLAGGIGSAIGMSLFGDVWRAATLSDAP